MQILTDTAKLNALITAIGKAGTKLDKDIQTALVGATFQAVKHGNTNPVNALYCALTKGQRRTACAAWIVAYCPVQKNAADEDGTAPFSLDKERRAELLDVVTAEEHCDAAALDVWTEFVPEKNPTATAFDLRKQLTALLNKVAKASKDGRAVEGVDLIPALSKLLETADEVAPL